LADQHADFLGAVLLGEKGAPVSAVNMSLPAAVTVFPDEIYQAPRSRREREYHKLPLR
jgi:hypothetical protein